MNWEAVSAIGQLLGAVAVVITLVYVSREVRANPQAMVRCTRDSVCRKLMELNHMLAQDDRLAWIFQHGSKDPQWESLSEEARARLAAVLFSLFKVFENLYLHTLNESIEPEVWEYNNQMLFVYATQPGCRRYWEMRRAVFDVRFRTVVDSITEVKVPAGHEVTRVR